MHVSNRRYTPNRHCTAMARSGIFFLLALFQISTCLGDELPTLDELLSKAHHIRNDYDFYPGNLKRSNVQGRVELSFTIGPDARPSNVRVEKSKARKLNQAAITNLENFQFVLPADWEEKGGSTMRYALTVEFKMVAQGAKCVESKAAGQSTPEIAICGSIARVIEETVRLPRR